MKLKKVHINLFTPFARLHLCGIKNYRTKVHHKMKVFIPFLLYVFICLPFQSIAQTGIIKGKVIDSETGMGLPYATILVKDNIIGTSSDETGKYRLTELDTGDYYVEASYLGYERQTRLVRLEGNDTITIHFGLQPLKLELKEIEVTASEHDFLNEPMPFVKMDKRNIERMNVTNTADLLEDINGVSVARAGNWGSKPYFQGMTDSRVIMFIDGIKTTQSCPMGMDACSATMEPDMISSMEVQVGPGSAQYGSGNMGGVISVSTIGRQYMYRDQFKMDIELATRYKSVSNSRTGVLMLKGGNKKFDFAAGVGGGMHDNYKVPDSANYTFFPKNEIPFSGYNSKWGYVNARYRPAPGHQISIVSQIYRADSIGWPSRFEGTNTVIPKEKRDMLALKYQYETNGKHFKKLKADIGFQPMYHNMVNILPENTMYVGNSKTDNFQVSVKANFTFGFRHFVTAGLDGWIWKMNAVRKTVTDTGQTPFVPILNHGKMYEGGIFVLDRYVVSNKLIIDGGLRLNYVFSDALPAEDGILSGDLSDRQVVWTGNIAPLFKINKHLSIAAALVKGYNAATPVDRFISSPMLDGFYNYGNPNLNPEINFSKRISVRGMFNKWNWNVEFFHNSLTDLIQRIVDTTLTSPIPGLRGVKVAKNITKGVITGTSAYVSFYATPKLQISLNASYLYGFDNTGSPLPNIAPFEVTPKISYENTDKGLWMAFKISMATGQNRFAPEYGEIYTSGYTVFDLSGGWEIANWLEISAGIQNFTNRYYRMHLNQAQLPEPGLNIFASAKIKFPVIGKNSGKPGWKEAKLVTLKIEGMACQFCANTVRERTEALPDVIQSLINLQEGKAEIIVGKNVSLDELTEAIQRAGFDVQILSVKPYEEKK
jgi:iron complex outermembrane recepter protein